MPIRRPPSLARTVAPVTTETELGRLIPTEVPPVADQNKANDRTQIFTYFTKPGPTRILYNADQNWVRLTLLLETAGPVSVGQMQVLTPVLSGKGGLLATGIETTITVAKGNRIFIAATAVNRIRVTIEPVPWLEQILGGILQGLGGVAQLFKRGGR